MTPINYLAYTTNNAYDSVLLVAEDGEVLGAWTVTPEVLRLYLETTTYTDFVVAQYVDQWPVTYPEHTAVSDYGSELKRSEVFARQSVIG